MTTSTLTSTETPTPRTAKSAGSGKTRCLRACVAAVAVGVLAAASPLAARAATSDPVWIKRITGSQDYGFHIVWSDGGQTYTPTRSESTAECGEYDTRVERVACRASTRTEYRWMSLTKRSLRRAS